ncbi:sigma-70 family RNA polymerase sigma factor [Puia sp.]|jgi:RNA polymerase sigma-70 factor (ECF subfamily)|uniref:RNA polymerase sigma factor n=1 Tax=Puia sp. TaxID=2045100 RepID=UPI002F40C327
MNIPEQIQDARSGNAAAQKALFDHLADPMMALCCRYLKSRQDAEEVLLDGFYKFFSHLKEFRYQGEAALHAWIKRIMVNECLMFLRRRHAFLVVPEMTADEVSTPVEPLADLSAAEIFDLIVQLPVGYRTVFNLHVIEGMEHREIAKVLGIAEGTSKSQLSKARVLLQKMLLQKGINYVKRVQRNSQ